MRKLNLLFFLSILLPFACRGHLAENSSHPLAQENGDASIYQRVADLVKLAEVVHWGEVSHQDAETIEMFTRFVPTLHDAGFRTLYIETSDNQAADVDHAMQRDHLELVDITWSESRQAWIDLLVLLKRLKGWRLVAIDFKKRDGLHDQIRSILNTGSAGWKGVKGHFRRS